MSIFGRIIGTLTFKRDVVEDIEQSAGLTLEAFILIIIAWICGVFSFYLSTEPPGNPLNTTLIFSLVISQAIFTLSWFLVAAILGNAFGGETSFLEIVRCMGYAYIISVLQIIPGLMVYTNTFPTMAWIINLLIIIWALINTIFVLSVALDKGIISAAIIGLIAVIVAVIAWWAIDTLLTNFLL
ncbi:MAG: YIP1 family protein [Candidatus Hermodarchaeota archaeon]